jgi:serine/threonine protein kinase
MQELSLHNCRLDKRYELRGRLGRGSYAEIFVARDTLASVQSVHANVVIKALNVALGDDLDEDLERTLVENFQNEAVALDRVRHPNIISRLGHGTARDLNGTIFHYLVLEYLAGGDLQRLAKNKTLEPLRAMYYIEQVCAGVRHAHQHGVIHRDIKPQNLLLTSDLETVKIADFGVARVHQADSPITRVGTNIYAPPEHSPLASGANDEPARLSPASDIYSLAKSLYTLMTGEAPRYFSGSPITELPAAVRNEPWAEELKRVLARATADEPEDRHQSVDEFWSDLEPLRSELAGDEVITHVRPKRAAVPHSRVAPGYTPLAPRQPQFASGDLRSGVGARWRSPVAVPARAPAAISQGIGGGPFPPMPRAEDHWPTENPHLTQDAPIAPAPPAAVARKKRRFFRKFAFAVVFLTLFAGLLYGTHLYLRRFDILPTFSNPFTAKTGRANTDINLRPEPSSNNEPIGLVTKNSRVRIVKTQNNWYQVDIIEQGRPRDVELSTTRGWLNGRYVDLD